MVVVALAVAVAVVVAMTRGVPQFSVHSGLDGGANLS